jgi:hypothetical protein
MTEEGIQKAEALFVKHFRGKTVAQPGREQTDG